MEGWMDGWREGRRHVSGAVSYFAMLRAHSISPRLDVSFTYPHARRPIEDHIGLS